MRNDSLGFRLSCLALVLCSLSLLPAFAGIRPSFLLDYSSWHATLIALVEVTPHDGVFSVIESWKGELQSGELINVPELKPAPGATPISVCPRRTDLYVRDDSGICEQIPAQPPGSQMVLFLIKEEGSQVSPTLTTSKFEKWRAAELFRKFKASVAWIDGGQLYAFQQIMNPGPSVLTLLDISPAEMKDHVALIDRIQKELAEVVGIVDGASRAESLRPYVRSEVFEARRLALSELGKCGSPALPRIREMLDDPPSLARKRS